jgi:hypothetical protein
MNAWADEPASGKQEYKAEITTSVGVANGHDMGGY